MKNGETTKKRGKRKPLKSGEAIRKRQGNSL